MWIIESFHHTFRQNQKIAIMMLIISQMVYNNA